MPVYSLSSNKKLNDSVKLKLANLLTDTHCGITGAPEQFVHVFFSDGVPIKENGSLYIHANVRKGRNTETIEKLRDTLVSKSAEIIGVDANRVMINLLEIESKWIMEGGFVMPEPGEEEEWMEKVKKILAVRDK